MFCNHCGAQLPDGSKFCNSCGAQMPAAQPSAAPPTPQPAEEPKQQPPVSAPQEQTADTKPSQTTPAKKKNSKVTSLLIVLLAFIVGASIIGPKISESFTSGSQGSQSQQSAGSSGGSSADSANPAYDSVFDGTYIVHFQTFFNMEMESFVTKQEDGIICCADYGYKDDVVKQWVETMYIPVSGYTDSQKTELESTMRTQFATIEALSCCSVRYKMSTNYLTITFTYSDVDKAENYTELYNAGILQTNTFISMSATETALLNQGFIKK